MTSLAQSPLHPPLFKVYPTYEHALEVLKTMTNGGLAQREVDIVESLPLDSTGFDALVHQRLCSSIESGSVVLVVRSQDRMDRTIARNAIEEVLPASDNACTMAAGL